MRAVLIAMLVLPATARADSVLELVGGLTIPLGDSTWTNTTNPGAKLGVRAGVLRGDFGGVLQVDWTPLALDQTAGVLDTAGHEFRFVAEFAFEHHLAPKLSISARGGAGIDVAYGRYSVALGNTTASHSNSDVGLAVELAGGLWFDISSSIQLGGELGLPISYHSTKAQNLGDLAFDYTSTNLDLLFGVRLWSR